MKKIKRLIKDHKILFFICLLAFLIVLFLGYVFFSLFIGGSDKYGDRLDGIEDVEISEDTKDEVASFLEEKTEVSEASVRVQGKIIYINIVFNQDVSLSTAKSIANETLDKFTDDEKSFYDIGYYLTQVQDEDAEEVTGFVVTGSKNANLDSISWINS